jgi:hypothetical protein
VERPDTSYSLSIVKVERFVLLVDEALRMMTAVNNLFPTTNNMDITNMRRKEILDEHIMDSTIGSTLAIRSLALEAIYPWRTQNSGRLISPISLPQKLNNVVNTWFLKRSRDTPSIPCHPDNEAILQRFADCLGGHARCVQFAADAVHALSPGIPSSPINDTVKQGLLQATMTRIFQSYVAINPQLSSSPIFGTEVSIETPYVPIFLGKGLLCNTIIGSDPFIPKSSVIRLWHVLRTDSLTDVIKDIIGSIYLYEKAGDALDAITLAWLKIRLMVAARNSNKIATIRSLLGARNISNESSATKSILDTPILV